VEWAWVAGESAPEPRRITDRQRNKEHELEKRPTERYRKSRMAKNGNGNLKKKKKKIIEFYLKFELCKCKNEEVAARLRKIY
jgi:hypothetical protein